MEVASDFQAIPRRTEEKRHVESKPDAIEKKAFTNAVKALHWACATSVASVRQTSAGGLDIVEKALSNGGIERYTLPEKHVKPSVMLFNTRLHDDDEAVRLKALRGYYAICQTAGIHVALPCSQAWERSGGKNRGGKVIPAIRTKDDEYEPVFVFFFDDRLDLEGHADSAGICNLRDVKTGEFVDFCDGRNGFSSVHHFENTTVKFSTRYRVVLVKSDLMDAMQYDDYFSKIVADFSELGCRIVVYMDTINTIRICDHQEDSAEALMQAIYRNIVFQPSKKFDVKFSDAYTQFRKLSLNPNIAYDLDSLVQQITIGMNNGYDNFWDLDHCVTFIQHLAPNGHYHWRNGKRMQNTYEFNQMYDRMEPQFKSTVADYNGLCFSWFHLLYDMLAFQHSVIINSFEHDDEPVTRSSVLPEVSEKAMKDASGQWNPEKHIIYCGVQCNLWDMEDLSKSFRRFHEVPGSLVPLKSGLSSSAKKLQDSKWKMSATKTLSTSSKGKARVRVEASSSALFD